MKENEQWLDVVKRWAVLLLLFLLPVQVVWVFSVAEVNGTMWDLGTLRVFLISVFVFVVAAINWRSFLRIPKSVWIATAAVFVYLVLSMVWALDVVLLLQQLLLLLSVFLLCVLIVMYPKKKHLLIVFLAAMTLQSGLAIVQVSMQEVWGSTLLGISSQDPWEPGVSVVETHSTVTLPESELGPAKDIDVMERRLRAYGIFPHPNILGAWLAVACLLALVLAFRAKGVRHVLLSVLSFFLAIGLLMTMSRSAMLALVVGGIGWFVISALRKKLPAPKFFLLPVILFLGLGMFAYGTMKDQIRVRLVVDSEVTRLEWMSVSDRVAANQDGWDVFASSPLLGTGLANSTAVLREMNPDRSGYLLQPAHVVALAVLVELGVVGFVLLVGACVVVLWELRKKRVGLFMFVPGVLLLLIVSMFDHFLWTLWPGLVLCVVVLGLSMKCCKSLPNRV